MTTNTQPETVTASVVDVVVDGDTYQVDTVELFDPTERMLSQLTALEDGSPGAVFTVLSLLGVDTSGWRVSKAARFMGALEDALEMSKGESVGSGS